MMQKMANRIAENISGQMNYDNDKKEVIAYGLTALFQMSTIAICVSIIGLLAGFWYETILIYVGVGLLRKSTGGAHAQTLVGCTLISVITISLMAALSRFVLMPFLPLYIALPIYIAITILCLFIAYRKVPVDSPNKPITRPEKIKRLRKQSFITIIIYAVLSVSLLLFSGYIERLASLSASVIFVLLWQTFTLTKAGDILINTLDSKFQTEN